MEELEVLETEFSEETELESVELVEEIEAEEVKGTEIEETETEALPDQEVVPATLSEASTVEIVVDTEYLEKMNTSLSIISMILLFWCGAWMLRSWRTHMLKGGK